MAILNIGLQNLAMARDAIPEVSAGDETVDVERLLKSAGSQAQIRALDVKYSSLDISGAYQASTAAPRTVIAHRILRLNLHEEPIKAQVGGASADDVKILHKVVYDFDPSFLPEYSSKSDLQKMPRIKAFMGDDKHCRSRNYMTQFKQCGN